MSLLKDYNSLGTTILLFFMQGFTVGAREPVGVREVTAKKIVNLWLCLMMYVEIVFEFCATVSVSTVGMYMIQWIWVSRVVHGLHGQICMVYWQSSQGFSVQAAISPACTLLGTLPSIHRQDRIYSEDMSRPSTCSMLWWKFREGQLSTNSAQVYDCLG